MDKQKHSIQNGVLSSYKEELNLSFAGKWIGTGDDHIKQNKPESEK
jgi:hypothetical protein